MTLQNSKAKIQKGAPKPLFDRLIDTRPEIKSEAQVQNFLNEAGLRKSIAQELANIFDSRVASHIDIPDKMNTDYALLPEQFGIRDFAALTAQSDAGRRLITTHLRRAIERFEPRLRNPKVRIVKAQKEEFDITVSISGEVMIDNMRRKIQFPIVLSSILNPK